MSQVLLEPETTDRRRELHQLELLAQWMDTKFVVPGLGVRFGLDAIVGLLPGVGDTLTSFASLYILSAASRFGVPRATLVRMAANVGIDYIVGSVPLLGDLFDVYWKANQKNMALLRRHVTAAGPELRRARRGDFWFVTALVLGLFAVLGCSVALAYFFVATLWRAVVG